MDDQMISNADCVAAGKLFADQHGEEAWRNLCEAWHMPQTFRREKETFLAGLAMGFVEALKIVRDSD